jgi:hypothetical protein
MTVVPWSTKSKEAKIVEISWIYRNFLVPRHIFWADGPYIELESARDAS